MLATALLPFESEEPSLAARFADALLDAFFHQMVKEIDGLVNDNIIEDPGQLEPKPGEPYPPAPDEYIPSQGEFLGAEPVPPGLNMHVGIIGAGMAGLYTAMILKDLGISCEILEASDRPGGRIYTHKFDDKPGNYYDVGAMRFPAVAIMNRTFKLFDKLGCMVPPEPKEGEERTKPDLGDLIPYYLNGANNRHLFNNKLAIGTEKETLEDPFGIWSEKAKFVPRRFLKQGPDAVLKSIIEEWRQKLKDNFKPTFDELMALDIKGVTMRSYMMEKLMECEHCDVVESFYVTNWVETMTAATNHFDQSLVSTLLHSMEFDYPEYGMEVDAWKNPKRRWWTINGGSSTIIQKMIHEDQIGKDKIQLRHRVKSIAFNRSPRDRNRPMTVKAHVTEVNEEGERVSKVPKLVTKHYSHVITTTTTPCLQLMDLDAAGLSYPQREAIRVLRYDNSVKVGILFKKRWWADDPFNIHTGGVSTTDRPTRVTVYPSYALDKGPDEEGVLLACYNWAQDAARLGHLIQGSDPTDQEAVLSVVLSDLAAMHSGEKVVTEESLREMVVKYHVHDWYHNELTGGAFGMFGPGQFATFFKELQKPAANFRLFFAGELTSIYHGWVVASLNSARRAVEDMLLCRKTEQQAQAGDDYVIDFLLKKLEKNWDKVDQSDLSDRKWLVNAETILDSARAKQEKVWKERKAEVRA